jgi:transglutaminase-like putative cysteine protease
MIDHKLGKYLEPTPLSDSDNSFLKSKARRIVTDSDSAKESASKLFYFVRDHIVYGSSDLYAKASHALKRGVGNCKVKANVQMCLLRAVGIPARLHAASVKTKALKGLYPDWILAKIPQEFIHVWCECHLSGTWIACDATFDEPLFNALQRKGHLSEQAIPTIDWDGETDLSLLNLWQVKDVALCFV